jgi:hypothetical protein
LIPSAVKAEVVADLHLSPAYFAIIRCGVQDLLLQPIDEMVVNLDT